MLPEPTVTHPLDKWFLFTWVLLDETRSFLFPKVIISLESFLTSKNQNPANTISCSTQNRFLSRNLSSYSYCLTLEMLSYLVLPKGASITPARPWGITARTWVLSGRRGTRRILLKEKDGPGNDATMTRPMQENTTFKTLNFLGHRCPEDPGLCVPVYSSVPWQLLTQNNMQKAECTNSQTLALNS